MCAFPLPYDCYLPRNLSYCDGTYIGGPSIGYKFVHSSRSQKNIPFQSTRHIDQLKNNFIMAEMSDNNSCCCDPDPEDCHQESNPTVSSFDEGIYINLMDDLRMESSSEGLAHQQSELGNNGSSAITTTTTATTTAAVDADAAAAAAAAALKYCSNYTAFPQPHLAADGTAAGAEYAVDDTGDDDEDDDISPDTRPRYSPPPGQRSLEEIVSGETPMASICAEPVSVENTGSASNRNIVSSVQDYFSISPRNDAKLLDLLSLQSPIDEDDEFTFPSTKLRKSTSLKSTKTPPGTPRRKKVVRFADVMGLDLESVIHVLNMDSPPKIPASALADLQSGIENDRKTIGSRYLTACFAQPSASDGYMARVCAEKLCLENAVISDLTITGIIRVANIGFHKMVQVRYTTDGWNLHHDVIASYVHSSCDGPTDRFSFSIVAPADFTVGSRLEFAVSYTCGDTVYWDNNNGENYVFQCYAKTGLSETENSWMHFL